jgi:hypothetical protein
MLSLEELFCSVDDFCQVFEPQWQCQLLGHHLQKRKRKRSLCLSEVMTILIIEISNIITRKKSELNGSNIFQDWLVIIVSSSGFLTH